MPTRVLIVDSNLASNVLLSKTLNKAGYETRTAFTAEEAVTRVSQDKFDLIVADLGLPDGGSRSLLQKLNQSGTSDQVPVLALADGLEDQLAKSALQLGATDILPKPVGAEALLTRVKRTIERGPRGQVSSRIKKVARPGETGATSVLAMAQTPAGGISAAPIGDLSALDTTAIEAIEEATREATAGTVRQGAPTPRDAALAPSAPTAGPAPATAGQGVPSARQKAPTGGGGLAAPPNPTPPPQQAARGPAPSKHDPALSGATTEFGPPPARLDAPPATSGGSKTGGTRTAATTPPAGTGGAPAQQDRGKSGVSTIQLDARNFVDKHAHEAEAKRQPTASALSEGDELGLEKRTYTIVRELAAGAMGGTYLVRRNGEKNSPYADELECVLKVSFGDPVADESLRVEQLVLGAIDHPNVVKLLDMGFLPGVDGARFVVLERLYPLPAAYFGKDRAPAAERALDPVTAMRVYLNLVGGLHAIHAKYRLILGDIKPDNVMLRMPPLDAADPRKDYTAKLAKGDFEPVFIDFGSALSQEVLHTRKVESFTGSPAYMAPEVLTQGRHSARRDVFALSVTLYEMLTGEKPYGDVGGRPLAELVDAIKRGVPVVDLEKVKAIRFDEPFSEAAGADGAAARTAFLRGVADMIARGSDRDPAQRYSTYQLADECRIRFQVRPRQNPPPGARYETPIFQPLDPAAIRYTQPPKPPPEPPPEPVSEPGRHSKSGRIAKPPRPAKGGAHDYAHGGGPGSISGAIGHSAAAYREGAGILGPPPSAPVPEKAPAAAPSSQVRRLEIELAQQRVEYLRIEERAHVAEEALAAREQALRSADERSRQLEELARESERKRAEASEKAKRALERAQKAEDAYAALEKKHAETLLSHERRHAALEVMHSETEARAQKSEEAAALYRTAAEESEMRADRAEQALADAGPIADRWREAAHLLEQGAAAARLAADGARGIHDAARREALAEVASLLGPLADNVDEAAKDRPDDDPLRFDAPQARKLLDAVRSLRTRHRPTT